MIRVDEIMQRPALRALFESQLLPEAVTKQFWAQQFGADVEPPKFQLDDIDYISGIANLAIRPIKAELAVPGATNQTRLGAGETVVHFKHPVAWKKWFFAHFPGAAEKSIRDVTYVELPVIPAFGPTPMCVAARDSQTLVFLAADPERMAEAAAPGPRPAKSPLAARWAEVDGGLATFLATDADIKPTETTPTRPENALAAKIFASIRLIALGIDVAPGSHDAVYHVSLTCDNIEDAQQLHSTFESLLALAKVELAAQAAKLASSTPGSTAEGKDQPDETTEELRLQSECVSNCRVKVWEQPDGTAGILIETSTTLPDTPIAAVAVVPDKSSETSVSPK